MKNDEWPDPSYIPELADISITDIEFVTSECLVLVGVPTISDDDRQWSQWEERVQGRIHMLAGGEGILPMVEKLLACIDRVVPPEMVTLFGLPFTSAHRAAVEGACLQLGFKPSDWKPYAHYRHWIQQRLRQELAAVLRAKALTGDIQTAASPPESTLIIEPKFPTEITEAQRLAWLGRPNLPQNQSALSPAGRTSAAAIVAELERIGHPMTAPEICKTTHPGRGAQGDVKALFSAMCKSGMLKSKMNWGKSRNGYGLAHWPDAEPK